MHITPAPAPATPGQCQHLGIKDDARTCLAFPSTWNYCHRATPPSSVRLDHQRQFCQSDHYLQCPMLQDRKNGPLPPEIRGRHVSANRRGRASRLLAVLIVVSALAALLAVWAGSRGLLGQPVQRMFGGTAANATAMGETVASPSSEPLPALPPFPPLAAAPTSDPAPATMWTLPTYFDPSPPTPTPVSTAPGACGHDLEEPFGPGAGLLLHKVGGGDSLNRYENLYETSVAAIIGVNLPFPIPLRTDRVLVIPLHAQEVGDLPVFEPVQVANRNTPIQTMAFKVSADLAAFEKYNDFDASCRDFIGWVVAPRERPAK